MFFQRTRLESRRPSLLSGIRHRVDIGVTHGADRIGRRWSSSRTRSHSKRETDSLPRRSNNEPILGRSLTWGAVSAVPQTCCRAGATLPLLRSVVETVPRVDCDGVGTNPRRASQDLTITRDSPGLATCTRWPAVRGIRLAIGIARRNRGKKDQQ